MTASSKADKLCVDITGTDSHYASTKLSYWPEAGNNVMVNVYAWHQQLPNTNELLSTFLHDFFFNCVSLRSICDAHFISFVDLLSGDFLPCFFSVCFVTMMCPFYIKALSPYFMTL